MIMQGVQSVPFNLKVDIPERLVIRGRQLETPVSSSLKQQYQLVNA